MMAPAAWYSRPLGAAIAFLLCCTLLILLRPMMPVDETRYLTVAWEMWLDGSRIVPHLNGEVYSHKPPLLFWLINLGWALFGDSAFVARMVGPLAGGAAILLTGRLSLLLWPEDTARAGLAAWGLATSGVFLFFGSATRFETLLTAAVVLAMLGLWRLAQTGRWPSIVLLGAAIALGVMSKGPVMLMHLLPVALAWRWWRMPGGVSAGRYVLALALSHLVALALVMLWLGPALILGGETYRHEVLWWQSAGRMVQSFSHHAPVWYYLALLPVLLWPWGWGREITALWSAHHAPQARFLMAAAGGMLIAFSLISAKQIHYLAPALPAVCMLMAGYRRGRILLAERLLPMLPALALLLYGVAVMTGGLSPAFLKGAGVAPLDLMIAVILGVATMVQIALIRRRPAARVWVAPVTLIIVHLLASAALWRNNDPERPSAMLAPYAQKGVAVAETGHAGQFTFAARLPSAVRQLGHAADLDLWQEQHAGGVILSRALLPQPGLRLLSRERLRGDLWHFYLVELKND